MTGSHRHRVERLVEGEGASVDRCACGSVQVPIGPVTVRLSPESLQDVARVLARAQAALRVAAPEPVH